MPRFSEDDVVDFCVREAVLADHNLKALQRSRREEKNAEARRFMKGDPAGPKPKRLK